MAKNTPYGKYYSGTFEYDGINWGCEIRFDGPAYHQGGFDKCLLVKYGDDYSDGHGYFSDDKFDISHFEISKNNDYIDVYLKHGLFHVDWSKLVKKIVVKIKN